MNTPQKSSGFIWPHRILKFLLFITMPWATFADVNAQAQISGKQRLNGHVPSEVANLRPMGPLSTASNLQLAISLPLRNAAALSNLLNQIYDPACPNFHHYLTPRQFIAQFGPTTHDYQAVIKFA